MQSLSWQESLALKIVRARRKMKQLVLTHLADEGLTPPQFSAVLCLAEAGEICLGGLAKRAGTDEPTASRVVTRLVAAGYVKMTPDAQDRRRALIALTPSGRALAKRLLKKAGEVEEALVEGLGPEELRVLAKALTRVAENAVRAAEAREASVRTRRAKKVAR